MLHGGVKSCVQSSLVTFGIFWILKEKTVEKVKHDNDDILLYNLVLYNVLYND